MANTTKRLERSRTNRMLTGVCSGLGKYFGLDVTLVRIGFVVLTFLWFAGLVIYIVLSIIMPLEGKTEEDINLGSRVKDAAGEFKQSAQKFAKDIKGDKSK